MSVPPGDKEREQPTPEEENLRKTLGDLGYRFLTNQGVVCVLHFSSRREDMQPGSSLTQGSPSSAWGWKEVALCTGAVLAVGTGAAFVYGQRRGEILRAEEAAKAKEQEEMVKLEEAAKARRREQARMMGGAGPHSSPSREEKNQQIAAVFQQIYEQAVNAQRMCEHIKAAELLMTAASIVREIAPDVALKLISTALEELVKGGDYEQAHELLQSIPLQNNAPDTRFAREYRLADFCINMDSPRALDHLSRAEELAASCKEPKKLLAMVHSEFLFFNGRRILTKGRREKGRVLCRCAEA